MWEWLSKCFSKKTVKKENLNQQPFRLNNNPHLLLAKKNEIDPSVARAFELIRLDNPEDLENPARRVELQKLLVEKKVDPNAVNAEGWSLLHAAINIIASQYNPRGRGMIDRDSPLAILIACDSLDVDQLYKPESWRISALHLAVRKGLPEVVDMLLARGADQKIKDKAGKIPADYLVDDSSAEFQKIQSALMGIQFVKQPGVR